MMKNYTQYPKKYVAYEMNRISCDFETEQDFLETLKDLEAQGLDKSKFYILHGAEGVKAFDPTGVEHGFWPMLSRKIHRLISEAEERAIDQLTDDLLQGMIHLSVPAKKLKTRDLVHHVMDDHHGHHTRYMDRFFVEEYRMAQ
jgi:hypothetical protein